MRKGRNRVKIWSEYDARAKELGESAIHVKSQMGVNVVIPPHSNAIIPSSLIIRCPTGYRPKVVQANYFGGVLGMRAIPTRFEDLVDNRTGRVSIPVHNQCNHDMVVSGMFTIVYFVFPFPLELVAFKPAQRRSFMLNSRCQNLFNDIQRREFPIDDEFMPYTDDFSIPWYEKLFVTRLIERYNLDLIPVGQKTVTIGLME